MDFWCTVPFCQRRLAPPTDHRQHRPAPAPFGAEATHPTHAQRQKNQRRDSDADIALVRAGAQDITDHYPNPQGAAAAGHQAQLCAATGLLWVMRGYVKARRAAANLPLPGSVHLSAAN